MKIAPTGIVGVEEIIKQQEAEPVRPRGAIAIGKIARPETENAVSREIVQWVAADAESNDRLFTRCAICNRITEHDYLCGDLVVKLACLNHLETSIEA